MTRFPSLEHLAVIALIAVGCGPQAEQEGEPLRKVRIASNPHLSWGPLMIAQSEGFFRTEGLDVEFVPAIQADETLVGLITGDLDVRPGPIHAAFLSAVAQGARIRMVAGSGVLMVGDCTYFGIVLRPGLDTSGIPAIDKIRTSQDGSTRYVVSRMLARKGMSLDQMESNRIENAVLAMALANGSLDAAAVTEPSLTRIAKAGTLWLKAEDAVPGYQWSVLAFSDRLLEKERDTGLRFLRAYHRGVAQFRQGKTDRNVAILAEGTGETPEHTREACWPTFTPDSRINWSSIDEFQKWALSEGFMERQVTLEQAYDSTLVAETAPPPRQ